MHTQQIGKTSNHKTLKLTIRNDTNIWMDKFPITIYY
jgi:hypothetical protein